LEELAIALIHPNFEQLFHKTTAIDWHSRFKVKALERLNFAKFDLHFLVRQTREQYNPLFVFSEKGDLLKLKSFIKRFAFDPDMRVAVNINKKTPLHVATFAGHFDVVSYLIAEGFNVNARDKLLKTPLIYAC